MKDSKDADGDKEAPRRARVFGDRLLARDEELLAWSTQQREGNIPIRDNPLNQEHPRLNYECTHVDLPVLTGEMWDSQLATTSQFRKWSGAWPASVKRPIPLAAINSRYEDPYSDELAESKVLSQKGVNFIVFSRSSFASKQLAKKMSLEMNCVLINPMDIIEEHYCKTSNGFYIPQDLFNKLKESITSNNKQVIEFLAVLKSLLVYYRHKSAGLEDWLAGGPPTCVSVNKGDVLLTDGKKSVKKKKKPWNKTEGCTSPRSKNRKWRTPDGSNPTVDGSSEDLTSDVHMLDSEILKSPELQKLLHDVENVPLAKAEALIDHFFRKQEKMLKRQDSFKTSPLVFQSVAAKNFTNSRRALADEIQKLVESFDCYTRGYVLVYDPLIAKRDRIIWKQVISSQNPPDVLIFGQCPMDEAMTSFEALRVNPFLPYENYNSEFMGTMGDYYSMQSKLKNLGISEFIENVQMLFKDRNVPVEESLVLEYCKVVNRRQALCELSEKCKAAKVLPYRDLLGEGDESKIQVNETDEDRQEYVLDLRHYVKLPHAVLCRAPMIGGAFFSDCLGASIHWELHSSCVIKVDMRTPLSYQFSVIKRWFDYSGFYSKPRAKNGDAALQSVLCELLGLNRERVRLNEEFSIEYNQKMQSMKHESWGEGNFMINEEEARVEEEEEEEIPLSSAAISHSTAFNGMEELVNEQAEYLGSFPSESSLSTPTVSSLSEFESLCEQPRQDEFLYLRRSFEGSLSHLADLKDLQAMDDPLFFHTYHLHDKVYFLSTPQAQRAFQHEPAKYLLPLLPPAKCSVILVRSEKFATTYLAEAIATFFGASVIDYEATIKKLQEETKHKYLQSATKELAGLLRKVFVENTDSDYKNQSDKVAAWLDKAYQLVLYRKLIFKPLYWNIHDLYDYPGEEMYTISEFYHPYTDPLDLNKLFRRVQFKDLIMDEFLKAFEKYSDYSNIEPYFLKDCPEEVLDYDILLDAIIKGEFKSMGLIDIYGSYDLCNFYSCYPYRLLERLPMDLIPRLELLSDSQSEAEIRDEIEKFLFPLESVPLTVKEKMDAIGTEIINIETEARHIGGTSYGGWIIHGMPVNNKLYTRLSKAGIFPRNIIYVDDPEDLYKVNEGFHAEIETRKIDIERNLACYVTPALRKSVYPIGLACFPLPGNEKEIKEPECITNLGRKVAGFVVKFEAFLKMRQYNREIDITDDWPGEKGLKNQLGRNYLYDQLILHPEYDPIIESNVKKELDLYDVIYRKYGRTNFKPLESLAAIHSVTASTLRSFLYDSEKYKLKKSHKKKILKMIDSFFSTYVEDNYTSECLKLTSFKFIHEEKQIMPPSKYQNFAVDFSYLYHLAYALENSMLMSHELSDLFKNIYSILKNLGYTFGIQQDFSPIAIEVPYVSWEEKDKNRALLHTEKRSRAQVHLIDYEYIVRKILEVEKKNKMKKEDLIISEELKERKTKTTATDRISPAGLLSRLGTPAVKSILEVDSSLFMTTGNHYKFIIYFPQNLSFMTNEEKAYDLCVMTNRIYQSELENGSDQGYSANPLKVLLEASTWNDWYFVKEEDYGDLLNFWSKENIKSYFDLENFQKSYYEKISEKKGSHFLKKVISIQDRIEKLRQRKSFYALSVDEQLLLSYLLWIRDEYFKRYFIGFVDVPNDANSNQFIKSNFPNFLPKFSEFCKKYLNQHHKNDISKKHATYTYDIWPFRSNYKCYPRFLGIYNCTLWNDISNVQKKKQKYKINHTSLRFSNSEKFEGGNVQCSEPQNEKGQELINFLTNDLKTFKYKGFLEEVFKLRKREKICRISLTNHSPKSLPGLKEDVKGTKENESKKEVFFVNEFQKNLKNSSVKKGTVKKDGFQNKGLYSDNQNDELLKIQELKDFVFASKVVTKISWTSVDEYGPFNILYHILNIIRGGRDLPKVTNIVITVEEEPHSEIQYEGYIPQFSVKEEDLKIECNRENRCIVSLFDGILEYGLEDFSAELFGKVYYFCSHECLTRFRLAPEMFVNVTKALEKKMPFNVFYIELPGGLGRQICSLISYYFEINAFYIDDFLVQRYRKQKKDNDIRCISLKKLITAYTDRYRKYLEGNENFLWSYLIQETGAPDINRIIKELWKKGKYFCFYNFPYHKDNLRETMKKCVIPNLLVLTDPNCLNNMVDYNNIDFIKSYVADLSDDRNKVTRNYFQDFKWWVANWQKRFMKTFKLIKREELSQALSKLQINLNILQNTAGKPKFDDEKEIPRSKLPYWSNTYFPLLDGSDTWTSKSCPEQSASSAAYLFSIPTKKVNEADTVEQDKALELLSHACSESHESKDLKEKNSIIKSLNENKNNCSYLKSSRFQLPYCCKWRPAFKSSFDYDDLIQIENRVSFKKVCQNMKKNLQREINDELDFRQKIKQTVCSKKTFADDEANLKSEVLSIDSVGFEDLNNVEIDAEDLKKHNSLWLLTVALKHTNNLNPFPAPTLDKYFEYASPNDLDVFTDCQLETYVDTVKRLQTCFEGVNTTNFDVLSTDIKSVINSISESKTKSMYSECVQDVEKGDVEKILNTGYYFLSKYGRQCPVKCHRGSIYPQGTIMYDSSNCYPVVHRRYMYFLSSSEALEAFKSNPLTFVDSVEYNPPIPIKAVFFGPNTKWTKYIINTLAEAYSFEHISVSKALEHFISKSSWTKLGQRLKWQTSFVCGLPYPGKLPISLVWQAILSLISSPKSITHGFIISGLAPNSALFQIWNQSKFKPHVIFFMTVDNPYNLVLQQRQEVIHRFQSMGWKTLRFEYLKNSYLMSSAGCASNEIEFWSSSNNEECIAFIQRFYNNVHVLTYELNRSSVLHDMNMIISNLIKNLSLLNKIVIKESEDPLPIGNFLPFKDFLKIMNDCWQSECPVCVCTSKRCLPLGPKLFQPNVFLYKEKGFWVCQKHTFAFLASPEEFTTNFKLKLSLCKRIPDDHKQLSTLMFGFNGFCPVCYWVQQPHLEYQYRCGSPKYSLFYNNEPYKFCSEYCFFEFCSGPWLYTFLGKCKIETDIIPLLDTKYWSEPAMRNLQDRYIFIKDHKSIFFYNLLRLAANLDIFFPGLSKRETRIFFIYALAKRYMSLTEKADMWGKVLIEFLTQCGLSKKIMKKFLNSDEKDMELPDLLDYFASNFTI